MSLLIIYACVMDVAIGMSCTEVQGCPDDILLSMRRWLEKSLRNA